MKLIFPLTLVALGAEVELGANPIRRVVTLLQAMQQKVEDEGEKEKDLYEKFVCYVKKNSGALSASIEEAKTKISQLESQIKADTATKAQIDEELASHKTDRSDAQGAVTNATKQREKENAIYLKESGDSSANINALGKAVDAIEKGLAGGAFLQTAEGNMLKRVVETSSRMSYNDRQSVTAFLSGSESAPGSSEIVGILKTLKDEMESDHKDLVSTEETAVSNFNGLIAAKNKEIAAATRAIEQKTQRSGKLAVQIVEGKNDLEDTKEALGEDEEFAITLERDGKTKEKEFHERTVTRAEEIKAISETIKVLNDDDALDLFKKTLPSPNKASFLQTTVTMARVQQRAANIVSNVAKTYKSPALDLISMALKGKKVDFSKVQKLIDDLVVTLGSEQKEDDEHKEYCNTEFDTSDDKQKEINRNIQDLTHDKEEAETAAANFAKEIKALQDGIVALDKSVAEVTQVRKQEHEEFVATSAANQQALDLIAFAKNRLNKFYNPKMYKAPPPRELTEEERVFQNYGGKLEPTPAPGGIAGTGIGAFVQLKSRRAAPPPPPETFGAYAKKSDGSTGVIALIDGLSNELKKDMQQAEFEEKDAQEEYEQLVADSQKKRAADSKSVTTKEQNKAEADGAAETATTNLASANDELQANKGYIANLHKSCDFLVENYDFRKEARATEIDALKKAKSVLNGADYSLVQTSSTSFLRKH